VKTGSEEVKVGAGGVRVKSAGAEVDVAEKGVSVKAGDDTEVKVGRQGVEAKTGAAPRPEAETDPEMGSPATGEL